MARTQRFRFTSNWNFGEAIFGHSGGNAQGKNGDLIWIIWKNYSFQENLLSNKNLSVDFKSQPNVATAMVVEYATASECGQHSETTMTALGKHITRSICQTSSTPTQPTEATKATSATATTLPPQQLGSTKQHKWSNRCNTLGVNTLTSWCCNWGVVWCGVVWSGGAATPWHCGPQNWQQQHRHLTHIINMWLCMSPAPAPPIPCCCCCCHSMLYANGIPWHVAQLSLCNSNTPSSDSDSDSDIETKRRKPKWQTITSRLCMLTEALRLTPQSRRRLPLNFADFSNCSCREIADFAEPNKSDIWQETRPLAAGAVKRWKRRVLRISRTFPKRNT